MLCILYAPAPRTFERLYRQTSIRRLILDRREEDSPNMWAIGLIRPNLEAEPPLLIESTAVQADHFSALGCLIAVQLGPPALDLLSEIVEIAVIDDDIVG